MAAARPPPLLLTKRLTSFLHLNLSAHITTLLLLTPDGKLLAYASNPPIPIATLRTHATVAASLYAIHSAGTDRETIQGALGPTATHHQRVASSRGNASRQAERIPSQHQQHQRDDGPLAVTIQLESGVVLVIRRLQCGMLFVCMGPPDARHAQAQQQSQSQLQPQQEQHQQTQSEQHSSHASSHTGAIQATSNASAPPRDSPSFAAAAAAANGGGGGHHTPSTSPPPQTPHGHSHAVPNLGSPSDVASVLSAATTAQTTASSVTFGAGTAGVMTARRHAEELAKWLDERLGALEVPLNGFGGVV